MRDLLERRMLERAARAAGENDRLLGYALSRVSSGKGDFDVIANEFGVPHDALCRLALCARPRSDRWMADVHSLALATHIDFAQLVPVLRQLEAVEALTTGASEQMLMAARLDFASMGSATISPSDEAAPERDDDAGPDR